MDINLSLSPKAQKALTALQGENINLTTDFDMRRARNDVGDQVIKGLRNYGKSKFKNPTGKLAGSFTQTYAPEQNEIGSDLPYSRRREFGFSGRTDSLGRYYANDPGQIYMMDAITDVYPYADKRFSKALNTVFDRVFNGLDSTAP